MLFTTFLFYLFASILITSAFIVVSAKNTVHSVMFLILAFLNAAALFVMLGAEFLAMLLIIVYVGAIAVLFLFVVMMLNIDEKQQIKNNASKYIPLTSFIGVVLFIEILIIVKAAILTSDGAAHHILFPMPLGVDNVQAIGDVIYTDFIYPFQLAGGVLFIAMIGAIVLTIKEEARFIRKQKISDQIFRDKSKAIEIVKVESNKGINI